MRDMNRGVFLIAIISITAVISFASCNHHPSQQSEVETVDSTAQTDSDSISGENQPPRLFADSIFPDLKDSTIIKCLYSNDPDYLSSLDSGEEEASHFIGRQLNDPLLIVGDDRTKIILWGSSKPYSYQRDVEHYILTRMLVNRVATGWKLTSSEDRWVFDAPIPPTRVVFKTKDWFLLEFFQHYNPDGGEVKLTITYEMVKRTGFINNTLDFDTAYYPPENCDDPNIVEEKYEFACACPTSSGVLQNHFNRKYGCIEIEFNNTFHVDSCSKHSEKSFSCRQVWYMNTDTAFMAAGNEEPGFYPDTVFSPGATIKLSDEQIRAALRVRK
jgi:hypothetical protein